MTTGSDPASGLESTTSESNGSSSTGKPKVSFLVGLIAIVAVVAAIVYWFRRDDSPLNDSPQTEP